MNVHALRTGLAATTVLEVSLHPSASPFLAGSTDMHDMGIKIHRQVTLSWHEL